MPHLTIPTLINMPATELRLAHQQYILAKAAEGFNGPRWTDGGCAAFDLGMTDSVWEECQWDEVAARDLFDGEYREACAIARARAARKGIASVIN
jgi:hypothetical protein